MNNKRNYNEEFADNDERQYAYDFDWTIRDFLLQRVSTYLERESPTLEVGAYMGDMTSQILQLFSKLTVLEGSAALCELLSKRFGTEVALIQNTIENVEVSEKFQNIFLVHTLEHLEDPVAALKKIGSWLTNNGRMVVAVPNAEALSRQIAVRMGLIESNRAVTSGEYEHGHRRTYCMDELLSDVRQSGLKVVESGGVIVKPLSNSQFDKALEEGIISNEYVKGCDQLAREFPNLSASIFVVLQR
jgi:2-polyprenyl-3-methyl-5-hydroxy-6-metoxy-1,4-benzoquinol methylase